MNKGDYTNFIQLRQLREEDYKYVLNWSKDEQFCIVNGWDLNRSEEEVYSWWLQCVAMNTDEFIRMGIALEDRLIGYADLAYIKENSAEVGIAIGDRMLWGKGLGTHSVLRMLYYAKEELDISLFRSETNEANIRSRKMLEKIGFKEISRNGMEEYLGVDSPLIQYQFILEDSLL